MERGKREREKGRQGGGERTGRFAASHAKRMRNRRTEEEGGGRTRGEEEGREEREGLNVATSTTRNHAKSRKVEVTRGNREKFSYIQN